MPTQLKSEPRSRTAKRGSIGSVEDIARLATEVRILNSIVFKLAARDMEQRVEAALPGTSLLQYGVMRLLSREPMTLSELSGKMMLSPSTLVPAVDRLERERLVMRGKDPSDRRRTPLTLTETAVKALGDIPPAHPDDRITLAVSAMDASRAAQLRDLLHELLGHMSPDRDLLEDILSNHPDIHCKR